MLTRDQFLGFKPRVLAVTLPGGDVASIREMSAGDRDVLQFAVLKSSPGRFRSAVLAMSLCDEAGKLLFDPKADLDQVAEIPTSISEPIVEAALSLNGMTEEEREEAGKPSESQLLSG